MDNRLLLTFLVVGVAVVFGIAEATERSLDVAQTSRFLIMDTFRGEAVLDRTTQLIWERSPNSSGVTWSTAQTRCGLKTVGGQAGWRLPSFIELMTIIEPSPHQPSSLPALPAGHPFQDVKAVAYWTNDASTSAPGQAYTVDLLHADVAPRQKSQPHPLWCVRGGIPERPQPAPITEQPGLI
jgi:Protein of unknown function (DUF1566)